ncbi:5-oxoprolinase subunit PxpB [Ramlibacter sp.]|uniref:5-oxoprolinase subunit PxpB n=1 Tax=Ramlibacter sp. TaxID=1917967 RepID=UPI003D0C095B
MAPTTDPPRISALGAGGLLLDASGTAYVEAVQQRVWSLARSFHDDPELPMREVVPGVNNLLVVFDPLRVDADRVRAALLDRWAAVAPSQEAGREIEIPVAYGGAAGDDLPRLASEAGLSVEQYVRMHSGTVYGVACIGAMPGFAYLAPLPPQLAVPRRAVPRQSVEVGTVIVGGALAGIMPVTAPTGWHSIGKTEAVLFDAMRDPPCLFAPGDRVRFVVEGIA